MPSAADPTLRKFFLGLLQAVARAHGLALEDREDWEQQVWLRAAAAPPVSDPVSLLRALTLQEFRDLSTVHGAEHPVGLTPPRACGGSPEELALAGERDAELRAMVARLPARCPALLTALLAQPPYSYQELVEELGMPRGSIGPTRSRCLNCLRRSLGPDWHPGSLRPVVLPAVLPGAGPVTAPEPPRGDS
ncbi:sigma-70 family RNA polymerase sigma factor [Streptacidiphilus sp. EB129]|uniref:sigma-70 family RNA polymerase sigma factor n=1 Tax=Streptacidiphilus sp. EB129 TaxID=3156262 RepID=UPI00351530D0